MKKYMSGELLKHKKSFAVKLLVIMPVVTVLLAVLMMAGNYVQMLAYNWWYLLFLPFVVSYVSAYMISSDRKKNFHGLLGIVERKQDLMYGKIAVATWYLVVESVCFGIIVGVAGLVFGRQISLFENLFAGLLLILTFAWQIPLAFLLTLKCNVVFAVAVNVVCNIFFACAYAEENLWWIPFAIPARLMCIVLELLPNGLWAEDTGSFGGFLTVAGGIGITVLLYVALTAYCGKVFAKHEV